VSTSIDQTRDIAGGRVIARETVGRRRGTDRQTSLLQRVELRSASDIVLGQLQALILEGRLRPGERLPAEPELSEALGVGRSTVREAKMTLQDRGLIESRGRLGTFVIGPPADVTRLPALRHLLADPALPELHEARLVVEVGAIQLATERATKADLEDLYGSLDQIETDIARGDPDVWPRLVTFHRSLVRVAHNQVLLSLFDLLAHLLVAHQVPFYPSVAELHREVGDHRELVDRVGARDPDAAAELMRLHLEESEQLRKEALRRSGEGQ
jgi:GntR family transcriptional repressor for pyruvate dehydrogenase complex